jgi:hypothetical protein
MSDGALWKDTFHSPPVPTIDEAGSSTAHGEL